MSEFTIAMFGDIHANLPALESVLDEIDGLGCDLIVHAGDVIGIGPHPAECLQVLSSRKRVAMVMGNHERYISHGIPTPQPSYMSYGEVDHHKWITEQLGDDAIAWIRTFPYLVVNECAGVRAAFIHSRLRSDGYDFDSIPTDDIEELDAYFDFVDAHVVCFAHRHQFFHKKGKKEYYNPGAAGCSKDGVARFGVLRMGHGRFSIQSHEARYDMSRVVDEMNRRKVPDREFLISTFFGG